MIKVPLWLICVIMIVMLWRYYECNGKCYLYKIMLRNSENIVFLCVGINFLLNIKETLFLSAFIDVLSEYA